MTASMPWMACTYTLLPRHRLLAGDSQRHEALEHREVLLDLCTTGGTLTRVGLVVRVQKRLLEHLPEPQLTKRSH